MTRIAQLSLILAALALWVGSRLPWVTVSSFDGLGQPKTVTLAGSDWSTALTPLALLVLAATVATLAVRGWPLRLLAVLLAASSALMGYLGIGSWAVRDVSVRAAELAEVPLTALVGAQRHHWGAVLTLIAAVCTLLAAVLLLRSAVRAGAAPTKYAAPAARREVAAQEGSVDGTTGDGMSERMIWDALDEGRDPTTEHTEGR